LPPKFPPIAIFGGNVFPEKNFLKEETLLQTKFAIQEDFGYK